MAKQDLLKKLFNLMQKRVGSISKDSYVKSLLDQGKIKINEKVKVQDQSFIVVGIIKSVPDVSGFVAFGDWALAGKQTLEILKLNGIGSFLNYEYKVKFKPSDDPEKIESKIKDIFKDDQK